MRKFALPYGREKLECLIPEAQIAGVLVSGLEAYRPDQDQDALIEAAMAAPIGSRPLCELAKGKERVVVIASDHTRPVPSRLIMPKMLREIRKGNPSADITILIATGCHRGTTPAELNDKFGEEIVKNEKIVVHDCDDEDMLISIGTLPSGGELNINRLAWEADLLVSEGFIEPHFFAGFSGGRKSVLPGIASRKSVLANHCAEFIAHPCARTGVLENNPIHRDMVWAARQAKLAFIVNVVLNGDKEVIHAVAGDCVSAHEAGCSFLFGLCRAKSVNADIAISTNGGYPLDQNIYQAVKGMTAAEATVKQGGAIIMIAKSGDGHGGDRFYHQLADEKDIEKTMALFMSRSADETEPDQWQTQIMLRILRRAKLYYLSDMPDEMVEKMHMTPIHSVEEGLRMAQAYLRNPDAKIAVIPDGVAVMVEGSE